MVSIYNKAERRGMLLFLVKRSDSLEGFDYVINLSERITVSRHIYFTKANILNTISLFKWLAFSEVSSSKSSY